MATTIVNTEMKFNSSKECNEFMNDIRKQKTVPSNKRIAKTLEGIKKIKMLNIDGVTYKI